MRVELKLRPPSAPVRKGRKRGFEKGMKKIAGRQRGTPNRFNKDVQDLLWDAMQAVGYNGKGQGGVLGYMAKTAEAHRPEFLAAIVRVCPQRLVALFSQTNVNLRYETVEEAKKALANEGLLIDHLG
jgi:hypothetical protein